MFIKATITACFSLALFCTSLWGQTEKEMLKDLIAEDRSAVEAVVLYPEDIRNYIFEASTHPEILIKLSGMQDKTKQAFQDAVAAYPQQEQAKFYELTRYPGLIRDLAGDNKKSKSEIKAVLNSYPEDIHATALELGGKEYETLQKVFQLNHTAKQAFEELIKPYSTPTQTAIRALVKTPEVLTILTDNLELTILVGDVYKNDPEWIQTKTKELNLNVARRQAEELEDYKQQLEEDPEAYQEMLDAAELYAKDNNVTESKDKTETEVRVVYSYPYWYGYPYWYSYPYWTPVPYYYHTGFYISSGGAVVIIGLPSYHYVHWHYTYYPHLHISLHAHYHRHYLRHPHGHGGFHAAVNVNVNKNINIRKGSKTALPGKIGHDKPKLKLGDNRDKVKGFDQFRVSDNHRGAWSNRRKSGSGKLTQRRN